MEARSTTASFTIDYLYDGAGRPYAGVYRSGEETAVPFAMVTTDRGDVIELLAMNGDPFASYRYDAWGKPTGAPETQGVSGSVTATQAAEIAARQPLRYAGYCYDAESGLYYLSARHYDPATMQFLTKDPAKADGEESAYQYCGGDPVGKTDPSGLYTLNDKEKELKRKRPAWELAAVLWWGDYAKKRAKALFPGYADTSNVRNAFQHAVWNAHLARSIGIAKAKRWSDAHEFGAKGQSPRERKMDLHNNAVGLSIAYQCWSPRVTVWTVERRILESGRLWWFGHGV